MDLEDNKFKMYLIVEPKTNLSVGIITYYGDILYNIIINGKVEYQRDAV